MATIGQQLLQPETGWKRYDNTDVNINYTGDWTNSTTGNSYNSTRIFSNTFPATVSFSFKGTKLRIIAQRWISGDSNISISIDGEIETYSLNNATDVTYQALVYEKSGLENKYHTVVITKSNTTSFIDFDAVDIDENGILGEKPPVNKFLILSNDNYYSVNEGLDNSKNAIPNMTSYDLPKGKVSASSDVAGLEAWRAFNFSADGDVRWGTNGVASGWLSYEFDEKIQITKYRIRPPSSSLIQSPKSWTFEGSNDGNNWIILDTINNAGSWTADVYKEYPISNSDYYKIYRINITSATSSTNRVSISELEMYGNILSKINVLSTDSEQNFINHGMNKSTQINLNSQLTSKVFVEQSPTTLGNGKVFSKTIDTTKTPIKKVLIK